MKALIWTEDNRLELVERVQPYIRDEHDVLIRVKQTGICGTDRSILIGKFSAKAGTILGHESVGIVEKIGPNVTSLSVGDGVIINPTLYCGDCEECQQGNLNFCYNKSGTEVGVDRDGAFAEFILLPARFCHRIPAGMSFDRAVMVEPLACAMNNVEAAGVVAGECVVIVGGGPIGMVTAMLCLYMGARVTIVEGDEFRHAACANLFSSYGPFFSLEVPDSQLKGIGDVVIDTVGNLLERSLEYARNRGRIVVMGYNSKSTATIQPLVLLQRGLRIIGAGDYNSHIFPRAIAIAQHLPLEKIISDRFPLADFEKAFLSLASGSRAQYSALKVLIVPETEKLP